MARLTRLTRLLKLLKLLRLLKLPNILQLFESEKVASITSTFKSNKEDISVVNEDTKRGQKYMMYFFKICKILVYELSLTYVFGCLIFFVSEISHDYYDEQSWYHVQHMERKTLNEKVIQSMYFSLTIVSSVGYGLDIPVNSAEYILITVVQLTGLIFYSFIMRMLLDLIKN